MQKFKSLFVFFLLTVLAWCLAVGAAQARFDPGIAFVSQFGNDSIVLCEDCGLVNNKNSLALIHYRDIFENEYTAVLWFRQCVGAAANCGYNCIPIQSSTTSATCYGEWAGNAEFPLLSEYNIYSGTLYDLTTGDTQKIEGNNFLWYNNYVLPIIMK